MNKPNTAPIENITDITKGELYIYDSDSLNSYILIVTDIQDMPHNASGKVRMSIKTFLYGYYTNDGGYEKYMNEHTFMTVGNAALRKWKRII